jgi:soluble lytic murein transglycosylase-like protein
MGRLLAIFVLLAVESRAVDGVSLQQAAIARQRAAAHGIPASSVARQLESVRAQMKNAGTLRVASEPLLGASACEPLPKAQAAQLIRETAAREGLTPDLLRAVIGQESSFRPCAVSPKGAMGLMQLMPATAQQLGVRDPFNAKENVEAGSRLLKQLLGRYGDSVPLALGAYNAGPGQVDRYGGLPPFAETVDYVTGIMERLSPGKNPLDE